ERLESLPLPRRQLAVARQLDEPLLACMVYHRDQDRLRLAILAGPFDLDITAGLAVDAHRLDRLLGVCWLRRRQPDLLAPAIDLRGQTDAHRSQIDHADLGLLVPLGNGERRLAHRAGCNGLP